MNAFNGIPKISFNRVCVALFFLLYIGFYYAEYITYVKVSYLVLCIGFCFTLIRVRRIRNVQFILLTVIFILYSYFSSLWSVSPSIALSSSMQLMKSALVAILVSQLIIDEDDYKWAFGWLFFSGILFSLLYLGYVDISNLGDDRISTQIDEDLPNVNVVALIVSTAFVYFFCLYFSNNNKFYLILAIVSALVTILLGSRKSILAIVLCILLLIFKMRLKNSAKIVLLMIFIGVAAVMFIPSGYLDYVFERLLNLNFLSDSSVLDSSDRTRVELINNGFMYWGQRPLLGHGFYNFSIVNGREAGVHLYSHNNFIEVLVGGGLIGFILYYYYYYKIFSNLKKIDNKQVKTIILICILVLLFNHLGIVVLLDRFIWILLALFFALTESYKNRCKEYLL